MAQQGKQRKDGAEFRVTADDARKSLTELLGRAGFGDQRFVVTKNGKDAAALIGMKDFERLRAMDGKPA